MNIFVGNLSFKTTEQELQNAFEAFGEVNSVKIIIDRETLKSRGFAFVTMPIQDQAGAAVAGLNGKELNGFALKVNEARPRESGGPNERRSGSGYPNSTRRGSSFEPEGRSGGGGYRMDDRNSKDSDISDIYDTKAGRSGPGSGRRGGGHGRRPGGRRSS